MPFYTEGLGARPVRRWSGGAYLTLGDLWLCLSVDPSAAPHPDHTHAAFDMAEEAFAAAVRRLEAAGARSWKENRSEGASYYFLDPDGHRLELHVGTLGTRLAAMECCTWTSLCRVERITAAFPIPSGQRSWQVLFSEPHNSEVLHGS